jgi:uncharacterized membrane protein
MMHPDTESRDAGREVGLGVFATRRIPRGAIVWVQDELDQSLPLDRVRSLSRGYRRILDRYGFLDALGNRILCWDLGRFVNHACEPNVLPTPWRLEIAVRTIHAGEQITNDYATLNLERAFHCRCDAVGCRGRIRPGDFERLVDEWDDRIRAALADASQVQQPLLPWLDRARRRTLLQAIRSPGHDAPSISSIRLEAARLDPLAYAAVPRRSRPKAWLEHAPSSSGDPHGPSHGTSPTSENWPAP